MTKLNNYNNDDVLFAEKLSQILSVDRAINYQEWINVGETLKTINTNLFSAFDNFSKKSTNYDEDFTKDIWDNITDADNKYTFKALRTWASHDNFDKYNEMISEHVRKLLIESRNETVKQIAKIIYEMYNDKYVCTSIKNNTWYEYMDHRWIISKSGITLKNKISDELPSEITKLVSIYYDKAVSDNNITREKYIKKANNATKLIDKLNHTSFKKFVLQECSYLFIDTTFKKKT
jgi:hypothetical protein